MGDTSVILHLSEENWNKLTEKASSIMQGKGINNLINSKLYRLVSKQTVVPCNCVEVVRVRRHFTINKEVFPTVQKLAKCEGMTVGDFIQRHVIIPILDDLEKKG